MASAMEPTSSIDEIIELYKLGIDVTLIDENLRLTPSERLLKLQDFAKFLEGVREAGRRLKGNS